MGNNKNRNRRDFLTVSTIGITGLLGGKLFAVTKREDKSGRRKFITSDGKLVEIRSTQEERNKLIKRISNKELQAWIEKRNTKKSTINHGKGNHPQQ